MPTRKPDPASGVDKFIFERFIDSIESNVGDVKSDIGAIYEKLNAQAVSDAEKHHAIEAKVTGLKTELVERIGEVQHGEKNSVLAAQTEIGNFKTMIKVAAAVVVVLQLLLSGLLAYFQVRSAVSGERKSRQEFMQKLVESEVQKKLKQSKKGTP